LRSSLALFGTKCRLTCSPLTLFLFPLTLCLTACDPTLPPLRHQVDIGSDPYAVFVGGGSHNSDLYAVRADGGAPVPITFSNVAELRPALSPDGRRLAFLRGTSLEDSTPASVWLMHLRSGSERELILPPGAGRPKRVGWERDGKSLVVAAENGLYRVSPPPGRPDIEVVSDTELAVAESSLAVLLGDPVFTRVVPCQDRRDLCLLGVTGKTALLAKSVRDPLRWGPDSVAFFVGDRLQIRPLSHGRPRLLLMSDAPERPREMTFFEGKRERD
jgi:hypothetical protein